MLFFDFVGWCFVTAIMKPGIRLVKLLWTAHFLAGFIVICLGVLSNGGGR